jgi:cytidine deaminase
MNIPIDLINEAIKAREKAIAPYSNYLVGAALLTENNSIIHGCNVESKAYPTTLCAERVAIFSAIAQGHKNFKAIALVTDDGAMPCGGCRQIMAEYISDIPIYVSDLNLNFKLLSMQELLPYAFTSL